jgi:arsenate reductase
MNSTDGVPTPATGRPLIRVLFVCIGNSCRSQMAEGFANKLGQSRIRVWSAGLLPIGWIAPNTRAVMEESGITLEGQRSKGIHEVPFKEMDVVVAMGAEVTGELLERPNGRLVRWQIPDPFCADLDHYRASRDLVETKVKELLAELSP